VCVNLYQTGAKSTRTSAPRTASPLRTRKVLIDAGARGLTNNRPYAMNAAIRQEQADASKKLTDPDEDEQVLRHRGKPGHFVERLVPQDRVIT